MDSDSRRKFLVRTGAAALSAVTLPVSRLALGQTTPLSVQRLSERTLAVIGPGSNVLVADTGDGIVLVDGGHESWSAELLQRVNAEFPSAPVTALINTHWHREQTGLNLALGEAGVEIIAHENTKLWLGKEVWVRWSDTRYPALAEAARPATTFYESRTRTIGDRNIEFGYMLNAHTDGDIFTWLPDENVLFTGGVVSNDGWPIIDWWTGGWIGGMLDGFDSLLEVANEETTLVPASGPLMTLADLRRQHEMYLKIFDRIHEMLRSALTTEEVLAERPTAEFDAQWGDPTRFVTLAFESMWGHLRDAYDRRMRNIA